RVEGASEDDVRADEPEPFENEDGRSSGPGAALARDGPSGRGGSRPAEDGALAVLRGEDNGRACGDGERLGGAGVGERVVDLQRGIRSAGRNGGERWVETRA